MYQVFKYAICGVLMCSYAEANLDQSLVDNFFSMLSETAPEMERDHVELLITQSKVSDLTIKVLDRRSTLKEEAKEGKWSKYSQRVFNLEEKGQNFLNKYKDHFKSVSEQYAVPESLLVAFMGIESNYCATMGDIKVLDALVTASFYKEHRRREYFETELVEYLKLMNEQPSRYDEKTKGSFAGAMGCGQFMPSSIRRDGVDLNNDAVVDLFDPIEAAASIGNLMAKLSEHEDGDYSWDLEGDFLKHIEIVDESIFENFKRENTGVLGFENSGWTNLGWRSSYSSGEIKDIGLELNFAVQRENPFHLVRLRHKNGDLYFLGHTNFYAISRYNNSTRYSVSVYLLSRLIEGINDESLDIDVLKSLAPN